MRQDRAVWVKEGIVDLLWPVLYAENHDVFRKYTRRAAKGTRGRHSLFPGIANVSSRASNSTEGLLEQMRISNE